MKKINLHMNRKFIFACEKDAEKVLDQAKETAKAYGYVTVADIYDFIGAAPCNHAETLIGWTPKAIEKADIYLDRHYYALCLPQCDWEKDDHVEKAEDAEKPSTGEPINITISSDEWNTRRNDIEQVFNELLRNFDKIKDHPIFINIM